MTRKAAKTEKPQQTPPAPLTDNEAKKPTRASSDRESPVQKPPGAPA
jgi:hypothetical protein